jgi:L-asparaginase
MTPQQMYSPLSVRPAPGHRARVCLIYTGGTIGSVPSDPSDPVAPGLRPASLDQLIDRVPWIGAEDEIELGLISFHDPVDSSHVTKEHWLAIASAIAEHYEAFDGFVVLHGTDTMAFTASALGFLLNNLAKPVVITGSQRPIHDHRGDAVMNLVAAVRIAGYKATGLPRVPEVTICFMDRLLRGTRATKVSTERWQGFDSPNEPPLGSIGDRIKIHGDRLRPVPDNAARPFYADLTVGDEIKIIYTTPGLTPKQLERDLRTDGLQGVLLLTYGAGNFPGSDAFLDPIRRAIAGGEGFAAPVPILNITQCLEGTVEMRRYEASGGLLEAGVASGGDMTLEAGLAKMYWALPRFRGEDLRNQLQVDRAGERSQDLFDLNFEVPGTPESVPVIEPPPQRISAAFLPDRLKAASLRVRGLQLEPRGDGPPRFRIFVNRPGAGPETPADLPWCVGEFGLERCNADATFMIPVTTAVRSTLGAGPATVSLVGVDAGLRCRSIHLALYTNARSH